MEIIKEEKTEEKMDENENKENKENVKKDKDLKEKEIETSKEIILIKDSLKEKENLKDKEKENVDGKEKNKQKIENVPPKKDKEPIKLERTISAPPSTPEVTACCSCLEVYSMSGVLLTRIAEYIQLTAFYSFSALHKAFSYFACLVVVVSIGCFGGGLHLSY